VEICLGKKIYKHQLYTTLFKESVVIRTRDK